MSVMKTIQDDGRLGGFGMGFELGGVLHTRQGIPRALESGQGGKEARKQEK